jgi:hypothetical protein
MLLATTLLLGPAAGQNIPCSTKCDQSDLQKVASGGEPLRTPLSLLQLVEAYAVYKLAPQIDASRTHFEELVAAYFTYADLGNYDLCMKYSGTHHCTLTVLHDILQDALPPDEAQVAPGPTLGMCLPKDCLVSDLVEVTACRLDEVAGALNMTKHTIAKIALELTAGAEIWATKKLVNKGSDSFCAEDIDSDLTSGAAIVLAMTLLLAGAVVFATCRTTCCVDLLGMRPPPPAVRRWCALANTRLLLAVSEGDVAVAVARGGGTRAGGAGAAGADLAFLDGVRVLATGYALLGQMYYLTLDGWSNITPAVTDKLSSFGVVPAINAATSAGTIFWLSGLLTTYHFLNRAAAAPAPAGVAGALRRSAAAMLHRLWRLWPTYLFVLLLFSFVARFLGSGPVWHEFQNDDRISACKEHWWEAALFINNLYYPGASVPMDSCMGWSSIYIAADVQLSLAALLLLPWCATSTLRYAMLRHAMLCYATPRYAMLGTPPRAASSSARSSAARSAPPSAPPSSRMRTPSRSPCSTTPTRSSSPPTRRSAAARTQWAASSAWHGTSAPQPSWSRRPPSRRCGAWCGCWWAAPRWSACSSSGSSRGPTGRTAASSTPPSSGGRRAVATRGTASAG